MKQINNQKTTSFPVEHFDVLVCKDRSLRPFINVFSFEEENDATKASVRLFGVIQVFDHSEQSAYLPNLITQVIRKEFFATLKKENAETSFEKSLKKANIALSDLAHHEIINWLEKFSATIGIISKKNFIFTKAGEGKILLIREKNIIDLGEELTQNEAHPIKTFANISSGKIAPSDKIILSTNSFFETFSFSDLQRHTKTFSSEEFDNLIKATLDTEGENTGLVMINIVNENEQVVAKEEKKKVLFEASREEKKVTENKEVTEKETIGKTTPLEKDTSLELEKKEEELSPFEENPEIYIKEEDLAEEVLEKREKKESFLKSAKNIFSGLIKTTAKEEKAPKKETLEEQELTIKKEEFLVNSPKTNIEEKESTGDDNKKEATDKPKSSTIINKKDEKLRKFFEETSNISVKENPAVATPSVLEKIKETEIKGVIEKKTSSSKLLAVLKKSKKLKEKIKKLPEKINLSSLSNFKDKILKEKILNYYKGRVEKKESTNGSGNGKPPKSALVVILCILILGTMSYFSLLLIKKINFSKEKPNQEETQTTTANPSENSSPEQKENVKTEKLADLPSKVKEVVMLGDSLFLYSEEGKLFRFEVKNKKLQEIPLQPEISKIDSLASMPDLNLIFLVSKKSGVFSYSPVVNKFQKNKISLSSNLNLLGTDAFMTFLYVFDKNSGQIYRYPRAEGGFGEAVEWLRENLQETEEIIDYVVDGSIRVIYSDGKIKELYERKQVLTFSAQEKFGFTPEKISSSSKTKNYYLLDKDNSEIIAIDKEKNEIKEKYQSEKIKTVIDFWANEEEKSIYLLTEDNEILKISH